MKNVVIATTTKYNNTEEPRFKLALQTIRKASKKWGYQIVVVDGSIDPHIWTLFKKEKALVFYEPSAGMGTAIRLAFQRAAELIKSIGVIVWMEPEKHTFLRFIEELVTYLLVKKSDALIPCRKSIRTYPEIQQYNEPFGNAAFRIITGKALDIWFGPQIFRAKLAHYYLNYDGEYGNKWDALQIPIVRMVADNRKIIEAIVNYTHPKAQKTEGTPDMLEKRLEQLNILIRAVKQESAKLGLLQS